MRIPTLYLDTSVLGGYFDDEWKQPTQELWRQMESGLWRFTASTVALDELAAAPERVRDLFDDTFESDQLVIVTSEMEQLAAKYIEGSVLTPKYTDDARHVAACTVAKIDYLVSWNFRHLVNVQRETGFNAVNLLQGYKPVRIVNPLELIYGNQDKDL
jgi:predicted nucleic acid-binding protein